MLPEQTSVNFSCDKYLWPQFAAYHFFVFECYAVSFMQYDSFGDFRLLSLAFSVLLLIFELYKTVFACLLKLEISTNWQNGQKVKQVSALSDYTEI